MEGGIAQIRIPPLPLRLLPNPTIIPPSGEIWKKLSLQIWVLLPLDEAISSRWSATLACSCQCSENAWHDETEEKLSGRSVWMETNTSMTVIVWWFEAALYPAKIQRVNQKKDVFLCLRCLQHQNKTSFFMETKRCHHSWHLSPLSCLSTHLTTLDTKVQ